MSDLGIILQTVTVIVLTLTLWSSIRLLDLHTRPQIECYLRFRPSDPAVFELVIANFGKGGAKNLEIELVDVDEADFQEHNVLTTWRRKGPLAFLGPQEILTDMFGLSVPLFGNEGKVAPLRPFRARVKYEWAPFWQWRTSEEVDYYNLDLEPFGGLVPEWPENKVASALKRELPKITKAIQVSRRPPFPANIGDITRDTLGRLETLMPELFAEMRADLGESAMKREFIIMSKRHIYNSGGRAILTYYYEDHEDLADKVGVLVNTGAVTDITYNNTDRYLMSEALVAHLQQGKHSA